MKLLLIGLIATLNPIVSALASVNVSHTAPDSTSMGPYQAASGEYHLPAQTDADVLSDRQTEIWAKVFYPKNIKNVKNKMPLIVMLHGNHGTCGTGNPRRDNNCSYTNSGTCPAGYVPTPNHEGYNYLAENLASWGYVVVSVNANRGITCGYGVDGDDGLNLARGRLVLKHLSLLYKWSTTGNVPLSLGLGMEGLIGKIDFANVGLFGHSRGGEGVRAAYNLYLDPGSSWPAKIPGLTVKAIFEVGAVDGQTSRVLDADGTVWNQLLPMCDGDVSDLEGRFPFERMLLKSTEPVHAQKSLYEVWGANHNFFNTEWQNSDSYSCTTDFKIFDPQKSGSPEQQKVALASVPAFFRSHLGNEPIDETYNQSFNPLDFLPNVVLDITQIDRDFIPSPAASESKVIEDFNQETGINSSGNKNISEQIKIVHDKLIDSSVQRLGQISWKSSIVGKTFFEAVVAKQNDGIDVSDYATLDFRIARKDDALNSESKTNFGVLLEDASGNFSNEISVDNYATINGPGNYNPMMQTVRIPIAEFKNVNLKKIHGVRFAFDKTMSGYLYFANIRLQKQLGLGETVNSTLMHSMNRGINFTMQRLKPMQIEYVSEKLNSVRSIHAPVKSSLRGASPAMEIYVASEVPFPAMNNLPVLKIGDAKFTLSRYADPDLKGLVFTVPLEQYKKLPLNSEITLVNGKVWQFGTLAKALKKQ